MTEVAKPGALGQAAKKARENPFLGLAALVAALCVPALLYMGFDAVTTSLTPCETIYRESSVGLTTKIKFLQSEGELQIGRQKLAELDDRAKVTALNLKTCCTVLDAGKLDPEQFLQCKAKGRDYEDKIKELVTLVRAAVERPAKAQPVSAAGARADMIVTGAAGPKPGGKELQAKIANTVQEASQVSKAFNTQVVQVRKAQAVEQLKAVAPKNVEIAAQEREPNNDMLNTNEIALGTWITGAIGEAKDSDYFVFTTPDVHRDFMRIEIQNRSTGLRPKLSLYNASKAHIGGKSNTTHGGEVTHSYVVGPNEKYYAAVSAHYGESSGVYLLRIMAQKSYDAFEPNQDILTAKKASLGKALEASIMDGRDYDYFVFDTKGLKGKVAATLENRSRGLRPKLSIYNASKAHVGGSSNTTHGGDVRHVFEVAADGKVYIAVSAHYKESAGDYTLTLTKQE